MGLTDNLALLIVLAVVGLLLPLCESRPSTNEPLIMDEDKADESHPT